MDCSHHRRNETRQFCLVSTQFRWVRVGGVDTIGDAIKLSCLIELAMWTQLQTRQDSFSCLRRRCEQVITVRLCCIVLFCCLFSRLPRVAGESAVCFCPAPFYSASLGVRGIVINPFVCVSVFISVCVPVREHVLEPLNRSSRNFVCRSPVAVARTSSGGVAISYVLSVLWMTSRSA